ncbi:hypothetical protein BCR43DRAFT_493146 [Syncephalastrum racemosum]|uniref:Gamma interferon inducible lysosomal thiol reductase-domain-containing protein n=1 Tax=Syncephalastrum racemosum TaxID=13706 RepID=A0A1X2HA58_SYNRA|nr:hypothetical protein BCR43DRAFT_493146 [Syncephalastrum racemosum]
MSRTLTLGIASLFLLGFLSLSAVYTRQAAQWTRIIQTDNSIAVPVELFVMSKCPDAVHCENVFAKVLDKVDMNRVQLDVNYIAQPDPDQSLGFKCKHGESECLGNVQELCFRHLHPDPRIWYSFILCMNEHYGAIGKGNGLAESCAKRLGVTYEPVEDCAASTLGQSLLATSVDRTNHLNVTKSCTIFINNRLRCIRDGTWKDCPDGHDVSDFVKTIEDAYD